MNKILMICTILLFSVTVVSAEEIIVVEGIDKAADQSVVQVVEEEKAEAVVLVESQATAQSVASAVEEVKAEDDVHNVAQVEAQVVEKVERKIPFWVKIRSRIEKMTPQKKPSVTTAVGGVRAAKNVAGKELYWKGEEAKPKFVAAQELGKFDQALKKAEEGEFREARQLFEDFVTEFPESELKSDAFLALKEIASAAGDNR